MPEQPDQQPFAFQHNPHDDTVTICGVRYSCEFFRSMGYSAPGTWLRIEKRTGPKGNRNVSVFKPNPDLHKTFDILTGRHPVEG